MLSDPCINNRPVVPLSHQLPMSRQRNVRLRDRLHWKLFNPRNSFIDLRDSGQPSAGRHFSISDRSDRPQPIFIIYFRDVQHNSSYSYLHALRIDRRHDILQRK